MRLFAITSTVPFHAHGKKGAYATAILNSTLLQELQAEGHTVHFQYIFQPTHPTQSLTADEEEEMQYLQGRGIVVLPPLQTKKLAQLEPGERLRTLRLLFSPTKRLRHFYPGIQLCPFLEERVRQVQPNAIVTLLSPLGVAATHAIRDIPKAAFQGDMDFLVAQRNLDYPNLFRVARPRATLRSLLATLDQRLRFWLLVQTHLTLMRGVDIIGNIAANTKIYARHGHAGAFYSGHTWPDPGRGPLEAGLRALEKRGPHAPVRIIGHVGTLNGSGSVYGLHFLLREVLPHLETSMQGLQFEVHIIGGEKPPATLEPLLRHPRVVVRGFVEDVDRELMESDMMLLLNNALADRAAFAYTRHMVAWAMGMCLIVHRNSKQAIPELEHGKNALLGNTGKDIAGLIAQAANDQALNRSLRENGRATYEQYFTPRIVTRKLSERLERLAKK